MFGRETLAELQLRKRALTLESDLNRLALQTEWRNLTSTDWVGASLGSGRKLVPWLAVLGPVAGFLVGRMRGRSSAPPRGLAALLKWAPVLALLLKGLAGQSRTPAPPSRPP